MPLLLQAVIAKHRWFMASKRRNVSSVSVVRVVAMMILLLVALIGLAFMLAPHKPIAPPASRIAYEPKPLEKTPQPVTSASAPEPVKPAVAPAEPETPESEVPELILLEEPEKAFTITGTVVTFVGREPVRNAQITAVRKFTQEDTVTLASLQENERRATHSTRASPSCPIRR